MRQLARIRSSSIRYSGVPYSAARRGTDCPAKQTAPVSSRVILDVSISIFPLLRPENSGPVILAYSIMHTKGVSTGIPAGPART